MRDKVSEARVATLHPLVRDEVKMVIELAEQSLPINIAIRVVQALRTFQEQANIYAQGRTMPGPIVTKAKPGQTYHNYGFAFDFCLAVDTNNDGKYDETSWDIRKDNDKDGVADWLEVVQLFEKHGWNWGGKWASLKDYPHLEKTFGHNWRTMLDMYNRGLFLPGTKYINIKPV